MITGIRTRRISATLHTPFVTALRSTTTVDTVLVEIDDDAGHTGYGEAPQVWQVTGESLPGAQACIDGPLAAQVRDRHADDLVAAVHAVRGAVHGNHGAKAAVDVALHDLAARRRGVPLAVLLGGSVRDVPTDVTLSVADADAMARAGRERRDQGFSVFKLKVGTDARADVDRVRAAREALGADAVIRLDANQGWNPKDAVRAIRAMEDAGLGVELVEQPVPGWDLPAMAWVRDRVDTPVLADESIFGVRDLVEVIRHGAADLINIKLAKCGGLLAARTLFEVAHEHGLGVLVGSMMETHVGVGAAASLVAAQSTSMVNDLDAAWWAAESPYTGGISYADGFVRLPDTPGLGVTGTATSKSPQAGTDTGGTSK
ncbi:MAG: mandelate racemase/muconate lactonizing enzyme family protein [Propionibacteriaceae bacterium]